MLSPLPPELLEALPPAAPLIEAAWRRGLAPDPERTVDLWADAERRVAAESGSPYPGQWITDRVPYLREPMRCMSLSHPARRVTNRKSAQTGFSEGGLNLIGQIMAETPAPVLVMLPSSDEVKTYNKLKLQPMIDATPAVRARVRDLISRDETGSTTTLKKFAGGYLQIVGANSSKNLQMRSARVLVNDEISEFPIDVDGRGDPMALAEARLIAFTGREKIVDISTPAIEGACRVTDLYDQSSRGRFMVACPHCDGRQALEFTRLRYTEAAPSDAAYACEHCGVLIEQHHKTAMVAAGEWLHERPELVEIHVGFSINALYSPFLTWAEVATAFLKHRAAGTLKVFTQQWLGLAWKEQGDAPDHERLHERRENYRRQVVPTGALWITGAADVQGDRIEWDVWAWGPGLTCWLLDSGIILGAPTDPATWLALTRVSERHFEDAKGRAWPIDAFGVDTGYMSHAAYDWVRRHPRHEAVFALDGRGDPTAPFLGLPRKQDVDFEGRKIGSVLLWPVGTHALKLEHYAGIRRTIVGPDADAQWQRGAMRLPDWIDRDYCKQLVSEFLADIKTRTGIAKREWRVIQGTRNERLDTAVYARALAHHLTDGLTAEDWQRLAAERAADPTAAQADLAAFWAQKFGVDALPNPAADARANQPRPPEPPAPPVSAREESWIEPRTDWFDGDE